MTREERAVIDWLAAERPAMLALLETLVNTDSNSYDKAGVDAVGAHVRRFLEARGIAHDSIANATFGDAIRATLGHGANRPILLMGHRDTVFPKGEAARRPFSIDNGRAYGPGVCRHEGRPRDERLRARGLQAVRRAGAARRAVHRATRRSARRPRGA